MSKWSRLDSLHTIHDKEHRHKMADLTMGNPMDPYTVQLEPNADPVPAVFFTVMNTTSHGRHHVALAINPATNFMTMICGSKPYADTQGARDTHCNFHMEKSRKGGEYICKHCFYVLDYVFDHHKLIQDATTRKKIEKLLEKSAPTKGKNIGPEYLKSILEQWMNTLFHGPSGAGKTFTVRQLLKSSPVPIDVHEINMNPDHEANDSLQILQPNPETNGWKKTAGELLTAFQAARDGKKKVVIHLEELSRSSRSMRNLLITAMDPQDGFYKIDDFTSNEKIFVPKEKLLFIATTNYGYADTENIDEALECRFGVNLFWNYDEDDERAELEKIVKKKHVETIQDITRQIRKMYTEGALAKPMDRRAQMNWATLIKAGIPMHTAAEMTWVMRVIEKDKTGIPDQGQLEAICELLQKHS